MGLVWSERGVYRGHALAKGETVERGGGGARLALRVTYEEGESTFWAKDPK